MRICKFMAAAGVASRRKCEEFVQAGRVFVNGERIYDLGRQVEPGVDEVTYSGRELFIPEDKVYIMLYKPTGCVSTCKDEGDRMTVLDCIKGIDARIFPVGRLDFMSEGLLIMTNDGELAQKLTHPSNEVTKRYYAVIDSDLDAELIKRLETGVDLEGSKTYPARIKIMKSTPNRTELTITIHEGKNRQVRRMFEALEKNVVFLKRISEGDLNLGNLKKGEWRLLTEEEIAYLKKI